MPIKVQNHIHLAETLGGAPENAPIYTWKIVAREEIPVVFLNVMWTLRARLRVHRALNESNQVVQLTNFLYRIKLITTGTDSVWVLRDRLKNMLGKKLHLCDIRHNDDGENHAPSTVPVYMTNMSPLKSDSDSAGLRFFFVEVELTDASRE